MTSLFVAVLAGGCFVLTSCVPKSPPTEPKDSIVNGVRSFHDSYNAKDFREIYKSASPHYRDRNTFMSHDRSNQELFDSCGKVESTLPGPHSEERYDDGYVVVGTYYSEFERCSLIEYFGFRYYSATNKALLMGHSVEPK